MLVTDSRVASPRRHVPVSRPVPSVVRSPDEGSHSPLSNGGRRLAGRHGARLRPARSGELVPEVQQDVLAFVLEKRAEPLYHLSQLNSAEMG
jgi:hypothetical protein